MLKGSPTGTNNYLIKQLPKATAFLNKKLEVVHASDKWIEYFDFEPRPIIGQKIQTLFGKSAKSWLKILHDCLKGKPGGSGTERFVDNDNVEHWFEWTNLPWYDENENVIGVIIQTEDVTERVHKELKLEKLNILFNEKSEITKIGSWNYDFTTEDFTWCDMIRKIFEVSSDFVPTVENALNFYKQGYCRNTISMAMERALKEGISWTEKLEIITSKGDEKWVITSGKPMIKNNKFIGLIGTVQNITEQVIAETKSKENERLLQNLIDNLPLNVYIKDLDSRKILMNKSEAELIGIGDAEELIGKNDFDIYDAKSARHTRNEDLEVMKTRKPILDKEEILFKKDGIKTTLSISKIPFVNEKNEVAGIIGMSVDITEKQLSQKNLEEKERHFRSIFNSSYQFTGILDCDGTFVEVNETALDFAAIKPNDVIGKKFWDAYWWPVPDFVKEGLKEIVTAVGKGETMRSEIVVLDKDKKPVSVDFSLKPIFDENNTIVSLLAEGRIITEMVLAREKLKSSELKFRTLYELSPISFILFELETGRILDFNPAFMKASGYDLKSKDDITYWDLLGEKSKCLENKIIKKLGSKRKVGPIEMHYRRKTGEEFPVIVNKALLEGKKGVKLVWSIAVDISESQKIEKQIREERKLLKTLIDNLPLNVYIKDKDSKKILVNKAECRYLGVKDSTELLGKDDFDLYDDEIAQISREEDLKVINSLEPIISRETINVKKDGSITTFLTSKIPLMDNHNEAYGLVGISLDISDLKQKEAELRDLINVTSVQNKKLINFAHIVSHNLRSHSANFSMLLDFLINETNGEERENITKMLVNASDSLLDTLENLNDVVAINTNTNLDKQPLPLKEAIVKIEQNLAAFLKNNNAKIINNISKNLVTNVIPAYLDSILMNFITNAIKYKEPTRNPVVTLRARRKGIYTILTIKDNGLGIDLKKHGDKLFGMYKTFHNHKDARGIGLYISKNQIEAMNGKVTVESKLGHGTTFKIYFNEQD